MATLMKRMSCRVKSTAVRRRPAGPVTGSPTTVTSIGSEAGHRVGARVEIEVGKGYSWNRGSP